MGWVWVGLGLAWVWLGLGLKHGSGLCLAGAGLGRVGYCLVLACVGSRLGLAWARLCRVWFSLGWVG